MRSSDDGGGGGGGGGDENDNAVPEMMKAIHIKEFVESLDEIRPSLIPVPSSPPHNANQTYYLVKITYASPTHVDTLYVQGKHQNNNRQKGFVHPPFTLGLEFSGRIVRSYLADSHSDSTSSTKVCKDPGFKKGDKVWGTCLGAFAEFVMVPETSLQFLPSNLSLKDAAAFGASTVPVSYGALLQVAKLRRRETCLVHAAAGGLGVAAVQIALAVGAKVIATVGSQTKLEVVEKLLKENLGAGAEHDMPKGCGVVRYDQSGWEDCVKKISKGRGVNVVFDTVGLVEQSIRCCAFNARIVIVGFVGRSGKMEKVAMNRVLLKQVQLLGYRYGESSRRMPAETAEMWKGLEVMLSHGSIRPVLYRDFVGLESIPEALRLMTTREVAGKIVVEIQRGEDDREARLERVREKSRM